VLLSCNFAVEKLFGVGSSVTCSVPQRLGLAQVLTDCSGERFHIAGRHQASEGTPAEQLVRPRDARRRHTRNSHAERFSE
jgi:hypothetical protein